MNTFPEYWDAIQRLRPIGRLSTWSRAGKAKIVFEIVSVDHSSISVNPSNGQTRKITRSDFESVFDVWDDYKAGKVKRHELSFSVNSSYIITLLHLVENRP